MFKQMSCLRLALMLSLVVASVSSPAQAQYSTGEALVDGPPDEIFCPQTERYGDVTDATQHDVHLRLTGSSNGQYVYSGYAKNGRGGSGENATVGYDLTSRKLVGESGGLVCPQFLAWEPPQPYEPPQIWDVPQGVTPYYPN